MIQTDWITSLSPTSGINTTTASTPYSITTCGTAISGASNWANIITVTGANTTNIQTTLEVQGDANFSGDVKIQGRSITAVLDKIEERLAILRPNEVLEDKWEKLKDLGRQYREMEKDILEKEKIWKILER